MSGRVRSPTVREGNFNLHTVKATVALPYGRAFDTPNPGLEFTNAFGAVALFRAPTTRQGVAETKKRGAPPKRPLTTRKQAVAMAKQLAATIDQGAPTARQRAATTKRRSATTKQRAATTKQRAAMTQEAAGMRKH